MGAINATNFIPEIWDAEIYRTLEDNLVAKQVVMDKSSLVSKYGDTIHFNGLADPTITENYDGSISYENLSDSRITMLINQRNTYGFVVDDVEAAMANVDLKGSQATRAGYELAKKCDSYVFGSNITDDAGLTVTDTSLDTSSVISKISEVSRKLDEANVPAQEKWMVIPPWVKAVLENAGVRFSINEGTNGKGGYQWCEYRDLKIYVTNNLQNTGTVDVPVSVCLAGSAQAIGFAEKLMKSRALEDKDSFGYYMSGLQVFGAKVIKPAELVKATFTYVAETNI